MTAVAALPPHPLVDIGDLTAVAVSASSSDPTAEARKRRREILASHRSSIQENAVSPEQDVTSVSPAQLASTNQCASSPPPEKKCRVGNESASFTSQTAPTVVPTCSRSGSTDTPAEVKKQKKKPQMKYDPDVPMSKEEAAVWRREQRRKRNRESAAASRQRQRDRITELEKEVEDWKTKFDALMARIIDLEKVTGAADAGSCVDQISDMEASVVVMEKPRASSPLVVESAPVSHKVPITPPRPSPPNTVSLVSTGEGQAADGGNDSAVVVSSGEQEQGEEQEEFEEQLRQSQAPSKMISRQAVKIDNTGSDNHDASPPLFPVLPEDVTDDDDSAQATATPLQPRKIPDPCLSEMKLEPIDSTLFPRPEDGCPVAILSCSDHDEEETEFGEFLLDAVDWL